MEEQTQVKSVRNWDFGRCVTLEQAEKEIEAWAQVPSTIEGVEHKCVSFWVDPMPYNPAQAFGPMWQVTQIWVPA